MTLWNALWGWARRTDRPSPVPLIVHTAVIEAMRVEGARAAPLETGGVLVGHTAEDGRVVVTAVVGPGPNARHSRTRFTRDGDYAQAEVDRLHQASEGRDDYVGEWHTHPQAGGPSLTDRGSMAWISVNPKYRREAPVLIIMERVRRDIWHARAFQWDSGRLASVQITAT